jgi:hypothetical protein
LFIRRGNRSCEKLYRPEKVENGYLPVATGKAAPRQYGRIAHRIQPKYSLKYELVKTKQRNSKYRTQITPLLPICDKNVAVIFREMFGNFRGVPKFLCIYEAKYFLNDICKISGSRIKIQRSLTICKNRINLGLVPIFPNKTSAEQTATQRHRRIHNEGS